MTRSTRTKIQTKRMRRAPSCKTKMGCYAKDGRGDGRTMASTRTTLRQAGVGRKRHTRKTKGPTVRAGKVTGLYFPACLACLSSPQTYNCEAEGSCEANIPLFLLEFDFLGGRLADRIHAKKHTGYGLWRKSCKMWLCRPSGKQNIAVGGRCVLRLDDNRKPWARPSIPSSSQVRNTTQWVPVCIPLSPAARCKLEQDRLD